MSIYDNLLYRPKYNRVGKTRFFSLRVWKAGTKDLDMLEIKRLKEACDPADIDRISKELTAALRETYSQLAGACITAPPVGASRDPDRHFATLLAQAVAAATRAEYFPAFAPRPRGGGSSPKTWDKRGEMFLSNKPPRPVCIVIDDIASTGVTLQECHKLLKRYAMVILIAWLYGEMHATDNRVQRPQRRRARRTKAADIERLNRLHILG